MDKIKQIEMQRYENVLTNRIDIHHRLISLFIILQINDIINLQFKSEFYYSTFPI